MSVYKNGLRNSVNLVTTVKLMKTSKQIPEFLVKNVSLHEGDFAPDC